MSSNWDLLKSRLPSSGEKKRKREQEISSRPTEVLSPVDSLLKMKIPPHIKSRYVGLDCEMVGVGPSGKQSALARCCVVDFDGNCVYDKFVRPQDYVVDFRTEFSGVRKQDLRQGHAVSLAECQQEVAKLIKGKIVVGHALSNDMSVLMLSHSRFDMRDTSRYKPYMRPHGKKGGKFKPRSLRDLCQQHLKISIQQGEHDPSEDARSAMYLYRLAREEWEASIREKKKSKSGGDDVGISLESK